MELGDRHKKMIGIFSRKKKVISNIINRGPTISLYVTESIQFILLMKTKHVNYQNLFSSDYIFQINKMRK